MVVVTAALPGVTVAGVNEHRASSGKPLQAKETACAKPFVGVTVSAVVAVPLDATLPMAGASESVKPGGAAVMVTEGF